MSKRETNTIQPQTAIQESATSKLEIIMGVEGLARLHDATVMVFGCGGVGSNCIEALARGGVGRLVIVDRDVVSASNINRQAIAFHSTIGRRKIDVMADMIRDINPSIDVVAFDTFVLADNLEALIEHAVDASAGRIDFAVDAFDTVSTKLAIADFAQRSGLNLISSMGGGNKLHPECLRIADIHETLNCPLSRVMRKECRRRGIHHLRVLYSCEVPVPTRARAGATRRDRSDLGTASFMPPIMGQMIAGEVIRQISGVGVRAANGSHLALARRSGSGRAQGSARR
ncbi:tRNA threonylcarbamoyladenosine dehydratase [Coriobacterium glomerans]|nr:tRNA threonylcarbamoyladenosine dehydratase [Coriobacterium glomerans]